MSESRFTSIKELPELDINNIKDTDYLIAGTLNDQNKYIFAKIGVNKLKEYYKVAEMQKLNIQSTKFPYLYTIYQDDIDYQYGISRLESLRTPSTVLSDVPIINSSANINGCTSFHKFGFVGHNVDRSYDNCVTFLVKSPLITGIINGEVSVLRHAVYGIASGFKNLTKLVVDSKKYIDDYKLVPLCMNSGINDTGLCVTMNSLIAGDDISECSCGNCNCCNYHTTGTNPEMTDLNALMVVRVLLDNCSTIESVKEELNKWNVWCPNTDEFSQEYRWTVTDSNGNILGIEIINNKFVYIDGSVSNKAAPNIATNFYLSPYNGRIDNILLMNKNTIPMNETLTLYSKGLERYYIMRNSPLSNLSNITLSDLFSLIIKCNFTKLYTDFTFLRYSEFVGDYYRGNRLSLNSSLDTYIDVKNIADQLYSAQQESKYIRLGKVSYTSSTVIYDINKGYMYIVSDEVEDLDKAVVIKLWSEL